MGTRDCKPFGIALVVPLRSTGGIFGPSCCAVAQLAVEEVNRTEGILGRPAELHIVDGGLPPALVAREVAGLVDQDRVQAITGWHTNPVRNAIVAQVRGRVPYVYTALYEGGEARPGVFSSGEVPHNQVAPALGWLRRNLGATDWVVVGHDYSWPHKSARFVVDVADRIGIRVLGAAFAPMDDESTVLRLVDFVERSSARAVMMFFVGHDAAIFNRRFADRGLHLRMLRYSPLMDESMLLASGVDATQNLYSSAAYYRSLVTQATIDLQSRYSALHGPLAPPLNNTAESIYEGIYTLYHLYARAKTTEMTRINSSVVGLAYDGPRGVVQYHGPQSNQHVYLAQADGFDFDVLTGL